MSFYSLDSLSKKEISRAAGKKNKREKKEKKQLEKRKKNRERRAKKKVWRERETYLLLMEIESQGCVFLRHFLTNSGIV